VKVLEGPFQGWPPGARRRAATIGVYDGVHLGHRHVITRLGESAARNGMDLTVVTFRNHPATLLSPERVPPQLSTLAQRLEQFAALGVDVVGLLDFDERLRRLPPEVFVADVLVAALDVGLVSVGEDFRFGYRQQGDVTMLAEMGSRLGFEVDAVPLVGNSVPFGATQIRRTLAAGDLEAVNHALGRPFQLRGVVVRGDGRGRSIGFPTANLRLAPHQALPGRGVYAVRTGVRAATWPAVANVGVRPTFDGVTETVEVHVLDRTVDLYDRELQVDFIFWIRSERRFAGVDELVTQITQDAELAAEVLARGDSGFDLERKTSRGPSDDATGDVDDVGEPSLLDEGIDHRC